jgi:hypothetical protein
MVTNNRSFLSKVKVFGMLVATLAFVTTLAFVPPMLTYAQNAPSSNLEGWGKFKFGMAASQVLSLAVGFRSGDGVLVGEMEVSGMPFEVLLDFANKKANPKGSIDDKPTGTLYSIDLSGQGLRPCPEKDILQNLVATYGDFRDLKKYPARYGFEHSVQREFSNNAVIIFRVVDLGGAALCSVYITYMQQGLEALPPKPSLPQGKF